VRRTTRAAAFVLALLAAVGVDPVSAAGFSNVATTVHNLSASGPGEIRSLTETEICRFCHIPHNAVVPVPLWGHELSAAQYRMPALESSGGRVGPLSQPDGASRLCLSCHDGTVALGEIGGGPGAAADMTARHLSVGDRGFLGTDLTGSHPISFVVEGGASTPLEPGRDMGIRPLAAIRADPDVRLDAAGKMQCTTCHDPHSDAYYEEGRVPRFWVKPSLEEVCLTCHELR